MKRRLWLEFEDEQLRLLYPNKPTPEVSQVLNRTVPMVYNRAFVLGLKKSAEYLSSSASRRFLREDCRAGQHRFKKGSTPFNKGLRRPGWAPGRMAATQFKKGNRPQTWRPVGSERVAKDGILERKVSDTGDKNRDWRGVHVLVWEEVNGPVPRGNIVVFADHNRNNRAIENLECITREELMRRNSIQRQPKEIALTVQLIGALNRQINKRSRRNERNEKQDVGLAQPSL